MHVNVTYIYILDTYPDAMITDARRKTHAETTHEGRCRKDAGRLLYKYFTSHFIARVRKGCSRVACERELEIEHKL